MISSPVVVVVIDLDGGDVSRWCWWWCVVWLGVVMDAEVVAVVTVVVGSVTEIIM
jgi:hypothetical protein